MKSRIAAFWALGIIFAANFFNYLDRTVVSALEGQLRPALQLEKWEYGLLWTLFTIGYMVCAVPIGLLADRYRRTRLFSVCIVIWSIATICSGLAETKWMLYAARVFIGVGEAGCLVIGPSLISDLFSKRVRSKALSWFYLAMPLGGTAAYVMTGLFLDIGWRNLFYCAGVPGFAIAVLIYLLPEPERGGTEGTAHGMHGGGSVADYLRLLRIPTLLLIILAQALAVILLVPLLHYGVEFFVKVRHMGEEHARIALGIMALVGGGAGTIVSGFLGDRLVRRTKRAYAILAAVSYLAALPCLLIGFTDEREPVFLAALVAGSFFLFLCMPAVNTQIANSVPPAQRATAWDLAVFILHLLGDMLAPPIFGKVCEAIGDQQAFTYFSTVLAGAGLCCIAAIFTARRDADRVAHIMSADSEARAHLEPPTNGSARHSDAAGVAEASGA
jgi:MFS transporter, Spinster family, sphingosine-1-phosphate transporter